MRPTLHRLGIQAFEPVLVEGKAIQIHPLVCAAFNADFDGDQMAVHLPLSAEAQAEARLLMLSAHNILSPAHGRPIAVPSQDMIIGAYYLTEAVDGAPGEGRAFASLDEAVHGATTATRAGATSDGETVSRCTRASRCACPPAGSPRTSSPRATTKHRGPRSSLKRRSRHATATARVLVESTLGRFLFNEAFPPDFPFQDAASCLKKRDLTAIVGELVDQLPKAEVAESLDNLKDLGFEYATQAGLTIAISDVKTPPQKAELLERFEREADKVEQQFDKGLHHRRRAAPEGDRDLDRRHRRGARAPWRTELAAEQFNPIEMMVGSGARGNVMQVRQIAGMRGLVANPRGEIIPRPIKSNFREGLSVLEYFISTHGARKGLADTALRTADSGLPHPPPGRRRAGAHRARRGLRHEPRHLGRGGRQRPRAPAAPRDPAARPLPRSRR